MTALDDARTRLFAALAMALPDGRAQQWTPSQVNAPVVWIDSAQINLQSAGARSTVVVATFPVYCVVDGGVQQQLEALDAITAIVWDASSRGTGGAPVRAATQPLDVGGPSLRAVVVDVDIPIAARTLCDA